MDLLHTIVDSHVFNKGSIIGLIIGVLGSFLYKKLDSYVYSDEFTYKINRVRKIKKPIRKRNNADKYYCDDIDDFKEVITNHIKNDYLVNFYNNIDSLKIIDDPKISRKMNEQGISGEYFSKSNKIRINEYSYFDSTEHEMLHMASNNRRLFSKSTGFSQSTKPFLFKSRLIGNGLNEGYTQLLTERMFTTSYVSTYHYLAGVCECLEEIIGKDAMEKSYFNGDLRGLINDLSNYADHETILSLIQETDTLLFIISRKDLYIDDLSRSIILINHLLNKIYKNKVYRDCIEGKIREDEIDELTNYFGKSINSKIRIKDRQLAIINKRTEKYLNKE